MYLPNPSAMSMMQHNFLVNYGMFEFRVFFFLDWLPY